MATIDYLDIRDRHALGALASDVIDSCRFAIPEAVRAAIQSFDEEIEAIKRGEALSIIELSHVEEGMKAARIRSSTPNRSSALMRLAFKSNYFFIRAFQDAAYRVAFQLLQRKKAPGGLSASMESALKPNAPQPELLADAEPVARLLGESSQEYLEWFGGWRAVRNRIKFGRGASIIGSFVPGAPEDDIGINLVRVSDEGGIETDLSRATRVSQITRAVEMSTLLASRLAESAQSLESA